MSGAQWSPERLDAMADHVAEVATDNGCAECSKVADALRDFARVVGVLGRLQSEDGCRVVVGHDEEGQAFACIDHPPPDDHGPLVEADNPLAAILALADALAGESGSE